MNGIIIILLLVVVCGVLFAIVSLAIGFGLWMRSQNVKRGNSYGLRNSYVDSSTSGGPGDLQIIDDGIDPNAGLNGVAFAPGYMQADSVDVGQSAFDPGAVVQQGSDSGAFGSGGADTSAASNAGWDAGSAAGASDRKRYVFLNIFWIDGFGNVRRRHRL